MAFRGNEMFKKILKKVKEEKLSPGLKDQLKKYIPDSKVVMGRAKRGLYAGRHIQFGNQVSEDGGNNDFVFAQTNTAVWDTKLAGTCKYSNALILERTRLHLVTDSGSLPDKSFLVINYT